jgi:antitoxin component of MazEF toxin-antitoxin module
MVTIKEDVDIRIIQGLDAGKTLAVTLPRAWMRQCRIKKGDRVKLKRVENQITLEKLVW